MAVAYQLLNPPVFRYPAVLALEVVFVFTIMGRSMVQNSVFVWSR